MPFSKGSSRFRDRSWVSHIVGRFIYSLLPSEPTGKPSLFVIYCSCCLYQNFFFHSSMSLLVLWYPFHYIIHAFLPILVKCPLKSSWLINLHCLFRSWKPSPMVLLITFLISEGCVRSSACAVPHWASCICCLLSNPFNTMWGNYFLSLCKYNSVL